jgi:hypothetical protein
VKKFVLFLFGLSLMMSCEETDKAPSGFGQLEGNIFLKNESNPLEGLGVRVAGNCFTSTDAKGYFYLYKIPEGVQTLDVLDEMDPIYTTRVGIISDKLVKVAIPLSSIQKNLPDFTVVDVSNECNWDYWVVGKEEYFYIDAENSLPKAIFYSSLKNGKDFSVDIDYNKHSIRATTDKFILLFENFKDGKVDLGLLYLTGEFQILRGIPTDFVWPSSKGVQSKADVIRWAGRILGAMPCIIAGTTAVLSGGLAILLAIETCGTYFLKMADNFFDDAHVKNGFTQFVTDYKLTSTLYDCTLGIMNPSSCVLSLAQSGLDKYADYTEEGELRQADILRLQQLIADNTPLKEIIIQPGPEGKDARITLIVWSSSCTEQYEHSGNDSLIKIDYRQVGEGCGLQVDEMLLQFSLNQIPVTSVVSSARLEIYCYGIISYANQHPTFSLSKLKSSWDESTVSWENQPQKEFIRNIDFEEQGQYSWHSLDVANILQDWISRREGNFGFQISAAKKDVSGEVYTSDHPYVNRRPKLIISYY